MYQIFRNILCGVAVLRAACSTLRGKNFVCISQLTSVELKHLIDHSIDIKSSWSSNPEEARSLRPLLGRSMGMIFQKRSTRTRVSTETGMFKLGGHGLMLGPQVCHISNIISCISCCVCSLSGFLRSRSMFDEHRRIYNSGSVRRCVIQVNRQFRSHYAHTVIYNIGVGESSCVSIRMFTASVLSQFNDVILARVFSHSDIEELVRYSSVPGKTKLILRRIKMIFMY